MAGRFLILILIILINQKYSKANDYFTSIVSLHKLWEAEAKLIGTMQDMVGQVEDRLKLLSKFIESSDNFNRKRDHRYHETPLSVFHRLRRVSQELNFTEKQLSMENSFEKDYNSVLNELEIQPSINDLKGAAVGITRLQNTYRLNVEDIATGMLMGQLVSSNMSAHDCFVLGAYLYDSGKYSAASQWIIQAYKLLDKNAHASKEFPYLGKKDVLNKLIMSLIESDNLKLAKLVNGKLGKHNEDIANKNRELFKKVLIKNRKNLPDKNKWKAKSTASKLCNGELQRSASEERNLHCHYLCTLLPDCIISPFRVEQFSLDPYVAVYHNVIYESEMQFIRNFSLDKLERSIVGNDETVSEHEARISQTAWFNFDSHDNLNNLQHRLLQISELSLEYSELFQVVNYGVGGYYDSHYDFFEPDFNSEDLMKIGNRILTALFYLNEVEMGGATAFPYLKIAVPPKKGSALVWFNLHRDLHPDYRTLHVGCPVLKGSKWIATQWFHEFGQEFLRQCDLEPDHSASIMYENFDFDMDDDLE